MSKKMTGRDGLKVGDIVLVDGKKHAVWFRNDSRAAITPRISALKWSDAFDDGKIRFMADDSENISPNSELEIVERLGREGLAKLVDRRKNSSNEETESTAETTDKTMSKKNKSEKPDKAPDKATKQKKPKSEKPAKKEGQATPRAGKLGGYEGYSATSVTRAMGKAGWNAAEAAAFWEKQGVEVNPATINIQLRRGRVGDGDVAPLSKATLDTLRPKGLKEAKPAKKDKAAAKSGKKAKKGKSGKETDFAARKPKKPRPGDKAKAQIERLSQQVEDEPEEESPEATAEDAADEGEEAAE